MNRYKDDAITTGKPWVWLPCQPLLNLDDLFNKSDPHVMKTYALVHRDSPQNQN